MARLAFLSQFQSAEEGAAQPASIRVAVLRPDGTIDTGYTGGFIDLDVPPTLTRLVSYPGGTRRMAPTNGVAEFPAHFFGMWPPQRGIKITAKVFVPFNATPGIASADSTPFDVLPQEAGAGLATWSDVSAGLPSLDVRCLASHREKAWVGTARGVAFSGDHGRTWAPRSAGLGQVEVRGISATRLQGVPTRLWAATGTGVYTSGDDGATWVVANAGLGSLDVRCVLAHPADRQVAWAGTAAGLYRTSNGGASWALLGGGLPAVAIQALALHTTSGTHLWVGTAGGVWRSPDLGDSWVSASGGLTSLDVRALHADAASSLLVYAGTAGGLFVSTDRGQTWSLLGLGGKLVVGVTSPVVTERAGLLAAVPREGLWRSPDAGLSWERSNAGLSDLDVRGILADVGQDHYALVASGEGLARSDPREERLPWRLISAELEEDLAHVQLQVDPHDPDTLWAHSSQAGVLKSTDGGATWSVMNLGLTNSRVQALALDPVHPRTAYACTQYAPCLKTTDGGATWRWSGDAIGEPYATSALVHPARPAYVQAGNWRSLDGGQSWLRTQGEPAYTRALAAPLGDAQVMYFAGSSGLRRSSDGGVSAAPVGAPLHTADVYGVAVDPLDARVVYAAANGGVYRSDDAGATWILNVTPMAVRRLTIAGGRIYGEYPSSGVIRSLDGGLTWTSHLTGAAGNEAITHGFAVSPADPLVQYARTGSGLWRTVDGGVTWSSRRAAPLRTPLPLTCAATAPGRPDLLYAGGQDGRVWRRERGAWSGAGRPATAPPVTMAVSSLDPLDLLIGVPDGTPGVHGTTDGGVTWTPRGGGLPTPHHIRHLLRDPTAPATAWVTLSNGPQSLIYKTTDGGASWAPSSSGVPTGSEVGQLAMDDAGKLYVSARQGGVYSSSDGGASWTSLGVGAPRHESGELAPDPLDPLRLLLVAGPAPGSTQTLHRSTDAGSSWLEVLLGYDLRPGPRRVSPDPARAGGALLDCPVQHGVLHTADGTRWTRSRAGLWGEGTSNEGRAIRDACDSDRVFLTTHQGLFESRWGGAPAPQFGAGAAPTTIEDAFVRLAFDHPRGHLTELDWKPSGQGNLLSAGAAFDASGLISVNTGLFEEAGDGGTVLVRWRRAARSIELEYANSAYGSKVAQLCWGPDGVWVRVALHQRATASPCRIGTWFKGLAVGGHARSLTVPAEPFAVSYPVGTFYQTHYQRTDSTACYVYTPGGTLAWGLRTSAPHQVTVGATNAGDLVGPYVTFAGPGAFLFRIGSEARVRADLGF